MNSEIESRIEDNDSLDVTRKPTSEEYHNGSLAVDVKIETEETTIIDVDLDESPTISNTDPPDSTVSLEEGSGDEKKRRPGRVKRKAALNVIRLKAESSDETDSDHSQEDGRKDPLFHPQHQVKGATVRQVYTPGKRGRPPRTSHGGREPKVPKLHIRTDIAARTRTPVEYIAFICEWGQCEQQFIAIGDCWDHVMNNHLRAACIPETETLRNATKCCWKGCPRLKRCSLPFAKFSHLTRHVTEAHPLRSKSVTQDQTAAYYAQSGV